MQLGKFNLLVDASWGSSGKGAASTRLADIHNVCNVSSCNYPNAGHFVQHNGERYLFKSLPSPVALHMISGARPTAWIGPNSGIDIIRLSDEMASVKYAQQDIHIHSRAMMMAQRHVEAEMPGSETSTEHISSTMSGSGAALTEKAMRRPEVTLAGDIIPNTLDPHVFSASVRDTLKNGGTFLHEVSQGFALSLNHGTHYPNCTSRDCTAQQGIADFMIPPPLIGDIYLNVRSFPIRVGNNYRDGQQTGYSGGCWYDQHETTWRDIAVDAGMPEHEADALADRERTSVTNKIRRVFTQSWDHLRISAEMNGATKLVLNFPQYISWEAHRMRGGREVIPHIPYKVRDYISRMEDATNLPVVLIGTGAEHYDYIFLE